ncbi:amino-acid N-acetyltransferase [Aquisalimonas sp.]|uniref:amino-acid N-acetyltransferase n=1 Tax=Aquisalimonas sp. TaxID=1872621 RepID=UPI0025BB7898|nr:amino-acid N-acetyltransferase [Aquisalimonas sp.]
MARDTAAFVQWFRRSSPYINAHRGRTMVVSVGGGALRGERAAALLQDIALLNSLGVRVVLVPGARPQIEERLRLRNVELRYHGDYRITDAAALEAVKEAVGALRVEIEALLSMGLANSPMAGFRLRVASGNFVTAKPLGVRDGVDYQHTGEVRRIDTTAIRERLAAGNIVLVLPLGCSPTGEVFNLVAEDVALCSATALAADKLLYLTDGDVLLDEAGELIRELDLQEAGWHLEALRRQCDGTARLRLLDAAVRACRQGVQRVHLVNRERDGGLLLELFTRDGVGTLVAGDPFESLRPATADDVGGILRLIEPLEREGVLVRRSREELETRIGDYLVVERDGMIIATAALSPHRSAGMAELECFVIHPEYRGGNRGDTLLRHVEREARTRGLEHLFVLTTRTAHWFRERGFEPARLQDLPVERQSLYNLKRRSQVFIKALRLGE